MCLLITHASAAGQNKERIFRAVILVHSLFWGLALQAHIKCGSPSCLFPKITAHKLKLMMVWFFLCNNLVAML